MNRPKVGETFEAFFGSHYKTERARVIEWDGCRCFFSNGYYLIRGGESVGFLL